MELGFHLLEHGEVVDDLLWKGIDGARKMCQGWQEARRAAGRFWCLLEPAGGESAGESARIVVCRPHGSSALSCRRSGARGRRHGAWTSAELVTELGRARSVKKRMRRRVGRVLNDVWAHLK
jgi:hypothetical protein